MTIPTFFPESVSLFSVTPAFILCAVILALSLLSWCSSSLFGLLALTFDSKAHLFQVWRWVSYGFVHLNFAHLLGNLPGLFLTMTSLSAFRGWSYCLEVFAIGVIAPAIVVAFVPSLRSNVNHYVGASAGLFALFGAMAVVDPRSALYILFVIKVPLEIAVFVAFCLSIYFHKNGILKGVWHLGHAIGLLAGVVVACSGLLPIFSF